jgi:predicted nucleic acid-binding protein
VGWVEALYGQIVGLDTAPLIYYLEAHPTYLPLVDPFFDALDRGAIQIVTSTVTLIEVLTQPLRQGNTALAQQYRELLLNTQGLTVQAVTPAIAEEAARLRAAHAFRTPDAIQLATALTTGASSLLTNDAKLARAPGLRVLVVDQLPTVPGPPAQSTGPATAT